MKKLICFSVLSIFAVTSILAKPVTPSVAQKIAEGFYSQNSRAQSVSATLAYTELLTDGSPAYYAFNINSNTGFVIISADDNAHPIIGYSTEKSFVVPAKNSPIAGWMNKRKNEIAEIRTKNLQADLKIKNEWTNYSTNSTFRNAAPLSTMAVSPLVQTTWDQSPYYNALCPGGSVTGCVATAMAQIMRYWNYPAHGFGASSYCDCTVDSFTNNYGTLSANYATTVYNWANMPLSVTSANNDVATLMYNCGVSVDMDYDPQGSGAWVITADDSICAQHSYVTYFGYDPNTIQGLIRTNFADTTWLQLLTNEINNGRPVQYAGDNTTDGHTWVCDGYDVNTNFHMNWGWSGQDNGYFSVNALNPGGDTFNLDQEALIGIQPLPGYAVDAGIQSIVSPTGAACNNSFSPIVQLNNFGHTTLTSCTLNYQLDNNTIQTQNWSGTIAGGQSTNVSLPLMTITAGTHTLTCYTSNPNGVADSNALNNQSVRIFTYGVTAAFAANQTNICFVPATIQLTNNSVNNTASNWSFGDGTADITTNPAHTYTVSGTYTVKLIASGCNGTLADSSTTTITISTPPAPTATGTTTCGPASVTLNASGSGTIQWQDSLGNALATGTSFVTPTLTSTTTYYAVNTNPVAAVNGGPALNTTYGGGNYLNASHYLIFNANAAFTLVSVDVYAQNTSANPTIQLLDNSGTVLQTITPAITVAGKNTITLNWPVNPGTGYQLAAAGNNINLYRNALTTGSIPYPINVSTLATITGDDADPQHYYWFYNWKVQAKSCASPAVMVTAIMQNCAGIITYGNKSDVQVYPNPAHNNLMINATQNINDICVIDILGNIIIQQGSTNEKTMQIDVSVLPAGIYFVKVNARDTQKLIRIIKQ